MKSKKFLVIALVVGAALAAMTFRTGDAFAGVTVCATDPIVTLSNGVTITMVNNISDTESDIQNVNYTLHIPAGVRVTNVQYDNTYGSLESFNWTADQSSGCYRGQTTVTTGKSGAPVQASFAATAPGFSLSLSSWGTSGQSLGYSYSC
jgi:hypothetical protein